jgi:DNA uptake protein ComE-like DNA-binding protein
MTFNNWLASVILWPEAEQKPSQLKLAPQQARVLADSYYRFKSLQEVRLAAALGVKIDVNRASVDDWLRLPGLSIHQARSLRQLTQSGVQFHCLEDVAAALGLPVQRLQPLAPVLQFCYYDPESVCTVNQVNPNTASVEQLMAVPVIDAALAEAVVRDRRAAGPYRDLADLQKRLMLPGNLTSELLHYLQF